MCFSLKIVTHKKRRAQVLLYCVFYTLVSWSLFLYFASGEITISTSVWFHTESLFLFFWFAKSCIFRQYNVVEIRCIPISSMKPFGRENAFQHTYDQFHCLVFNIWLTVVLSMNENVTLLLHTFSYTPLLSRCSFELAEGDMSTFTRFVSVRTISFLLQHALVTAFL